MRGRWLALWVTGAALLACTGGGDEKAGEPPKEEPEEAPKPEPAPEPKKLKDQVERIETPIGDETRVAWLHLPEASGKVPMVVVLHGGTAADGRKMVPLVDQHFDHGVAFLFPNGKELDHEGKAGKGEKGEKGEKGKRKAGAQGEGDDKEKDDDDPAAEPWLGDLDKTYLESVVSQVTNARAVDPEKVYVVGYAQGGQLAWRMACQSKKFHGFATVASSLEREVSKSCPAEAFPAPLLAILGTEDQKVLWTGDEKHLGILDAIDLFASKDACDPKSKTETLLDDLDPEDHARVKKWTWTCEKSPVRLYEINGGGHGWPTLKKLDKPHATKGGHDFEAMDEILSFFELSEEGDGDDGGAEDGKDGKAEGGDKDGKAG